jgi:hypothetical protein
VPLRQEQSALKCFNVATFTPANSRRGLELDYPPETAIQLAQALTAHLTDYDIGVIRIADLVAHLRYETGRVTDHGFDEFDDEAEYDDTVDPWFDRESIASPILLEGLTTTLITATRL